MFKRICGLISTLVIVMFLSGCFISTDTVKYWNGPDKGETIQTAVCISIDDSVPTIPVIKIKEAVMFDWDSNIITPEGDVLLNKVAKILEDNADIDIYLTGYASIEGTDEYNIALSQRRADSTLDALIAKGVSPDRIKSSLGKGEVNIFGQPLESNRRVMVLSVE